MLSKKAKFDMEKEEAAKLAGEHSLELFQSEFVSRLFGGKIEKENIYTEAEKVEIPVRNRNFQVLYCAVDIIKSEKYGEEIGDELKRQIRNALFQEKRKLEEELHGSCKMYIFRNVGMNIHVLLSAEKVFPLTEFSEKMTEAMLMSAHKDWKCHLTFGLGRIREGIEEVEDSFEKVRAAMKNRHILGLGKVIYSTDALPERTLVDKVILPTEELLQHIRYGMTSQVEQDIRAIYDKFRHQEYISLPSAKAITTELAITAFKGEIVADGDSVSYLYFLNQIQQLNTLDEMELEIIRFAVEVAEKRKISGSHKKRIADQALNFLQENYHKEELSLNEVADHLGISVPYLAVLFKQETGKNFGAHLLDIRMEKAKELLKSSDDPISDIAEKVGYNSPQYFAVCFKKYTGITPGNYRNQV